MRRCARWRTRPANGARTCSHCWWPPLVPASHSTATSLSLIRDHRVSSYLNAIFYVLRTGCQWRYLPADFPNHNTVYWYFAKWVDDGVFDRINDELRRRLRVKLGRDPDPTAASIDSQSVKKAEKGGIVAMMS